MGDEAHEVRRRDVACPFCGLVCDDLTVEVAGRALRVVEAGCALSRRRFDQVGAAAAPTVDGRTVDLAAAVARAAEILAAARSPVFVVAADVAGARAALRLADRVGAVVDHPGSAALFRHLRAVQDAGALTTTLSEVRNRADLVLVIGPDPSTVAPRFHERCLSPRDGAAGEEPLRRELFRLGPAGGGSAPGTVELPCALERLPEAVAALAALARGGAPAMTGEGPGGAALGELAARLKAARYATIVWAPALVAEEGAALLAEALTGLARTLARATRCVVLALGGGDVVGVNQACTWQSGYPLRTSFGSGAPEHDPFRFSAARMLSDGEADALLWACAFGERVPRHDGTPTILLAPPPLPDETAAAVCIPVGVPGIDHAGQMFRTDGVVALRLAPLRRTALPDLASVLSQVERRLAAGGRAA